MKFITINVKISPQDAAKLNLIGLVKDTTQAQTLSSIINLGMTQIDTTNFESRAKRFFDLKASIGGSKRVYRKRKMQKRKAK